MALLRLAKALRLEDWEIGTLKLVCRSLEHIDRFTYFMTANGQQQ